MTPPQRQRPKWQFTLNIDCLEEKARIKKSKKEAAAAAAATSRYLGTAAVAVARAVAGLFSLRRLYLIAAKPAPPGLF